jgi:hypothetical protein
MVDALRSARRVLRRGGLVVDLEPASVYRPRLALVARGWRRDFGAILRSPDEGIVAAHRAVRQSVSDGWFTRVRARTGVARARYESIAELDELLRQNSNWQIPPAARRRFRAAWRERPRGASIEIRRTFSLNVLRKRD